MCGRRTPTREPLQTTDDFGVTARTVCGAIIPLPATLGLLSFPVPPVNFTPKILPPIILEVPAKANAGGPPLQSTSKIGAF